jgi:hypothetical protein
MAKAAFNRKSAFSASKLDLNLRKKLVKYRIWKTAFYSADTWALRKVDKKYLQSFEMWCWRRMEKISWTVSMRNEEVLHRVKEERNILHTIRRRNADWVGHTLRRNCLLKTLLKEKQKVREGKEEDVSSYLTTRVHSDGVYGALLLCANRSMLPSKHEANNAWNFAHVPCTH